MRSAAAFVVLVLVGGAADAQPPAAPTPTVTLHGVVTTANDAPLPRVRVAMTGTPIVDIVGSGVLTDARGQFTMRVPAIGATRVSFSKAGYVPQTTALTPSQLTAQTQELRVRLARGGAIAGQVLDRSGGRAMATVAARRIGAPAADAPLSTTTNDLGEFRFGGLVDGRYLITVRPSTLAFSGPPAERDALLKQFEVEAATVNVSAGADVGNLSLTIDLPSELPARPPEPAGSDPTATASITGRVVSSNGTPLARVVVQAYRPFVAGRAVETDERGRYVIDRLTPGAYTVDARKSGFVVRQYGQVGTAATGRSVSLRDGQTASSIDITLVRGGAIAGTVVDEFGEPVQGVELSALQIQVIAGRRRALRVTSFGSYQTDDRGRYRLYGMAPGTYVVRALVRDAVAGEGGYAPLYFPGALNVDQAVPTKVELDATASAVDFTLTPTGTHRITGTLFDVAGRPGRGRVLLAISERSGATQLEPTSATAADDGTFAFPNVPPGDYVLQAIGSASERDSFGALRPTSILFASSFVTVATDAPPPVQLRLSAGATLRGRIVYEGLAEAPPRAASLLAFPADFDRGPMIGAGPMGFTLNPDNSFQYTGVFGPTLIRVEPRQSDWYLKSILFNGQDLADTPFDFGLDGTFSDIEVVISTTGAGVTGRVTDDRAAPVADYGVHVFSTFRDRWFSGSRWVKTARPTQDGSFRVDGLPPGDYWVAAIERIEGPPGGGVLPPDPQLLESLSSRATRIALGEGQSRDLTLRLTRR